jgi:hypothetical protein
MSGYARNTETSTLLKRYTFREFNRQLERNHGVLGGSSKWSIGLSAIAPNTATNPVPRPSIAYCVNGARTITVRNDTRIRHPDAERILAFFYVAGIYT